MTVEDPYLPAPHSPVFNRRAVIDILPSAPIITSVNRALVTGATGFVGSHLCEALIARGWEVHVLVHISHGLNNLRSRPVRIFQGDVGQPATLVEPLRGVSHVFHLAGIVKARTIDEFMSVNRDGTRNLLEQLVNYSRQTVHFVLISSIAAGGPAERPGMPTSNYGLSKLAGEQIARQYSDRLPITVLRFPPIYGPRDTASLPLIRLLAAGIRPRLDITFSLCYIADAVDAIIAAGLHNSCGFGPYAVSDGRIYSFGDWAQVIEQTLGRRTLVIPIPHLLLRCTAWMNEVLSSSAPVLNRDKAREMCCRTWTCSVTDFSRRTGFVPKYDLETGARLTIEWYRQQGWL